MANIPTERPQVLTLAKQLHERIIDESLSPGDRFLTAEAAARIYAVRRDVANKALQILEQRGVLVRKPRVGAIVLNPTPDHKNLSIARVHIIVQEDYPDVELRNGKGISVGLQQALPGCDVQLTLLPTDDVHTQLNELIRRAMRSKEQESIILVRSDYISQTQVAESGIPVVLKGAPWPGLSLASVNSDNFQAGSLHTQRLIDKGCEKIVLIRRERMLPGDAVFVNGILHTMAANERKADDLIVFEVPAVKPVLHAVCLQLRKRFASQKIGLIAHQPSHAQLMADSLPEHFVIHAAYDLTRQPNPDFPCCQATHTREEEGALIGQMLLNLVRNPRAEPEHRVVPMELRDI